MMNQNRLLFKEKKNGKWGSNPLFIGMASFLLTLGFVNAQEKNRTIKELWSKDLATSIQDVSLNVDKDGVLQAVAVQTYDQVNKATSFIAFSGDGGLIRDEKPSKEKKAFLLPDGRRVVYTEKWFNTKINKWSRKKGKVLPSVVLKGERIVRVEDHRGNLISNEWVVKNDNEYADVAFSPDGSICFVRGSAEWGGGYDIYGNNGNLLATGRDEVDQPPFFSPDGQYIGFCTADKELKLIVMNRSGQKVFEYKPGVLDRKLGPMIKQCGFSLDGSKIIVLSTTSLVVLDINGKVVSRNILEGPSIRQVRFLFSGENHLVISDNSRIWLGDLESHLKLIKDFGKDFVGSVAAIDSGVAVVVRNNLNKNSLVLVSRDGNILDAKELPSVGRVFSKNNFLIFWYKRHLIIFQV
jgi:WD40 repeat protein